MCVYLSLSLSPYIYIYIHTRMYMYVYSPRHSLDQLVVLLKMHHRPWLAGPEVWTCRWTVQVLLRKKRSAPWGGYGQFS